MKVVFLDIDGVLQPYNSKRRFEVDMVEVQKDLTKKLGIDYMKYYKYDVAAAALDWDTDAVERIRNILVKTDSKIVVSSDWRDKYIDPDSYLYNLHNRDYLPYKVRDFLEIWDLGKYWYADNLYFNEEKMKDTIEHMKKKLGDGKYFRSRVIEIMDFLLKHKEITNYVVIDDMDMSTCIGDHFVKTDNLIKDEDMEKAIKILNDDSLIIKR